MKIEYFVCFSSDFSSIHPPIRSRLIVVGDVLNVEYVLTVVLLYNPLLHDLFYNLPSKLVSHIWDAMQ